MCRILSLLFLFSINFALKINGKQISFGKVVIFGDSQTDTGNVYKLTNYTWPIVPPYYHGYFCNGPNWVDKINITDKSNYAYGGATTDSNFVQGLTKSNTVRVPGIRQQIAFYMNDTSNQRINFTTTIYIIWAGGNDLIYNSTLTVQNIIDSLMNGVRDLLNIGAKNLIIFNQGPVQAFPYFSRLNRTAFFTNLTLQAGNTLQTSLDIIRKNYTNASIQIFDVNTLLTNVVANQSVPLTNTVDACWTTVNRTSIVQLCQDPTKYVFVDNLHLTSTVHQVISDAINPLLSYNRCDMMSVSLNILLLSAIIQTLLF